MKNENCGKLIQAANNLLKKRESSGRRYKDYTGEVRIMSNGMQATIIAYRYDSDIDVEFEDGTIVTNKSYTSFRQGYIKHPDPDKCFWKQQNDAHAAKHIGEEKIMNNGMRAKIIDYKGRYDVDIEFEDGEIIRGICYSSWVKGESTHPTVKTPRAPRKPIEELIGQTNTMSNGMQGTIVDARCASDIDVKFEDGEITYHSTYGAFKKGNVCHPSKKGNRLGEENTMNNGMKCKIIVYRSSRDIDVEFEDGTIAEHKAYVSFQKGIIRNPNVISRRKRKKYTHQEDENVETIEEVTCAEENEVVESQPTPETTIKEDEYPDMFTEAENTTTTPSPKDKFLEYLAMKEEKESHVKFKSYEEVPRKTNVEQICAAMYMDACQRFLSTYTIPMIQEDLQQYIIGQDDLIKQTSIFIYYHMLRQSQPELNMRPLLIAGPSGSGKTEIWRVAKKLYSNYLDIAIVDGSTITQEGWSGQRKLSSILQSLNRATILVVDEFDKLASPSYSKMRDNVSHHIQAEFLKLLEGDYTTEGLRDEDDKLQYDPSTLGIVMVGAFERVREEKEHENNHSVGFIQRKTEQYDEIVPITDEDLIEFGVLPEIVGRISAKCTTNKLDAQQYLSIIRNQYSNVNVMIKELERLGIDATKAVNDDKIIELAERSQANMTGVRWVSAQIESELLELLVNADLRPKFNKATNQQEKELF